MDIIQVSMDFYRYPWMISRYSWLMVMLLQVSMDTWHISLYRAIMIF